MIHHIQKTVIDVLASKESARYGELKPSDMDGNQFTYHLKQLIITKLIQQNEDGSYSLSRAGQTFLVHRYENLDDEAHTIFLVIIRHKGKVLLRRRKVQPMLDYSGFVHGEPTADMSLTDSVKQRVQDKTGLTLATVTPLCSGLIRMIKNGNVESFSHAIIVTADSETEQLPIEQDETGVNFWANTSDLEQIDNLLPSCANILNLDQPQWFDWTYEV